ncbi:MAG TPA: hypothetical protein VEC99_14360, partial [Clostridia bacterium]|nr:hypothetical protein [Clostridia bacterium]
GRFAYTTEPLTAFRIHADQATRQFMREHLLSTEYYQLLVDFADRPWMGRETARRRLFEEVYQAHKKSSLPPAQRETLEAALDQLGREGYKTFKLQRKLLRPLTNLRRSVGKRVGSLRRKG